MKGEKKGKSQRGRKERRGGNEKRKRLLKTRRKTVDHAQLKVGFIRRTQSLVREEEEIVKYKQSIKKV